MLMPAIPALATAPRDAHSRWLCRVTSSVLSLAIAASSFPALAGFNPPSNLGRPGNREGAATRGPCMLMTPETARNNLITLVPVEGNAPALGLTLAAHPTFVWFMPASRARAVEFVLYEVDEQMRDRQPPLYQTTLGVNGSPGFESLTLPAATVSALQFNRDYHWQVSLICDPDEPSANITADGWIRRIEMSPSLKNQLATAKPRERSRIYAEAGLWYDALAELLALRRQDAANLSLVMDWSNLLRSSAVQLDSMVDQPLNAD